MPKMNNDTASGIASGDCRLDFDLCVAEAFRGDDTEDVGGHHAEGRTAENLVAERTGTVSQNDLFGVVLNDVEVALNPFLEIDENVRDLFAGKPADVEGGGVVPADLVTHSLSDDADKTRRFVEANNILKGASKFAQQSS